MLVISRKAGEGIIIDGGIKITIFETKDGSVKLGIEAPKQTLILRDELANTVKEENVHSINQSSELLDNLVNTLSLYKKDK